MKFGLTFGALNPKSWEGVAVLGDQLGFESAWLPEHMVIPVQAAGSPHDGQDHPPIPANVPVYDVFTYLAFLAGKTENIKFGTHVYNIGLRHPFTVARAATTLDIVSKGRFLFGIGASWLKEEWDVVGLDFATRGKRVDESLAICIKLWTDEIIEHHGKHFNFDQVAFEPKPFTKPHPPIIVGGDGPAALRRAATIGQGWIPMNHSLEQLPASIAKINEIRTAAGITEKCEITMGAGPVTSLDDVKRGREFGIDRMLISPWKSSREALDGIKEFADTILGPASDI